MRAHMPIIDRQRDQASGDIMISGKNYGKSKINGAEIMATDIKASICIVLARLISRNKTIVNSKIVTHIINFR